MKTVISTGNRAGQSAYETARHQADNIYMSIVNEISEQKIINNIYGSIGQIKKENARHGKKESFAGALILNFEKTNEIYLYKISEEGLVKKMSGANYSRIPRFIMAATSPLSFGAFSKFPL